MTNDEALAALKAFIEKAEYQGSGPLDYEWFYCPFCKASALDCTKIPHGDDCEVTKTKTALDVVKRDIEAADGFQRSVTEALSMPPYYYKP